MPRAIALRFVLAATGLGLGLTGCTSEKKETRAEMLQRGLNDKSLPDEQAVLLIARGTFRQFAEGATLPPVDGKVAAIVKVHGQDITMLPASVIQTAPGGIGKAVKQIQLGTLRTALTRRGVAD